MNDDSPERQKEIAAAIERVSVKLVQFGFATRTATHSKTGILQILLTPKGLALQEDLSRMFPKEDRFDFDELQAFLAIMSKPPRQ